MKYIDRTVITSLLQRWQVHEIDEQEVHEEAERLWALNDQWPIYPKENPESIVIEVLSQLEILNHQLITYDDIPAILSFLNTPLGDELNGWTKWQHYWESLDMKDRRKKLESNPYYIT